MLKVGGGDGDTAKDIHWHINSKLWYLPLDAERLDIGWVGVEDENGGLTQYVNPAKAAEITPERVEKEKRLMDCIDCHNRATHVFRSPDELLDKALAEGSIDSALPFIKREALQALDPPNPSLKEAYNKVEAIRDFYETSYSDIYVAKKEKIDSAINKLKEFARLTTFPEMNVDWNTYVDHSGHNEPPPDMKADWKTSFND